MANNATLAGHVIVEDYAIIGGLAAIHQFCRIGRHAMIGGMSGVGAMLFLAPSWVVVLAHRQFDRSEASWLLEG